MYSMKTSNKLILISCIFFIIIIVVISFIHNSHNTSENVEVLDEITLQETSESALLTDASVDLNYCYISNPERLSGLNISADNLVRLNDELSHYLNEYDIYDTPLEITDVTRESSYLTVTIQVGDYVLEVKHDVTSQDFDKQLKR